MHLRRGQLSAAAQAQLSHAFAQAAARCGSGLTLCGMHVELQSAHLYRHPPHLEVRELHKSNVVHAAEAAVAVSRTCHVPNAVT